MLTNIIKLPKVFISRSSKDSEFSNTLFNWLSNQGISVWLDQYELYPGIDLKKILMQSIQDVDYVLLLVTKDSIFSDWVKY
jgi:hypothetical protein